MRDEKQSATPFAKTLHVVQAFLLKEHVADGQGLINYQDIGINHHLNSKRQSNHHAGRIGLDRLVNEISNIRECKDIIVSFVDLLF